MGSYLSYPSSHYLSPCFQFLLTQRNSSRRWSPLVPSVAPCFHAHSLGATCPHCRIRSPMPLLPVSSTLASAIGPVGPCPTPSVVRALAGGGWGRGHNWEARHGALSTWELSSSRPAARRRRRDKVPWAAGGTTDGAHAVSALHSGGAGKVRVCCGREESRWELTIVANRASDGGKVRARSSPR